MWKLNCACSQPVSYTHLDVYKRQSYLTVNTIIYDRDMELMRKIVDAAREADLTAIIAADVAVLLYARSIGVEVHLSTQLNITNIESLKFYARYADAVSYTHLVSGARGVHVVFPEQFKIFSHQLLRYVMTCMFACFVNIYPFHEYRFAVDQKLLILYFRGSESYFYRGGFRYIPVSIFQLNNQRVKVGLFRRPFLYIRNRL